MDSLSRNRATLGLKALAFAAAVSITLCLAPSHSSFAQTKALTKGALYLTTEDWSLVDQATSKLFSVEQPKIGTVETWSNPESGNSGSVTLIMLGERDGMTCRRLQHDVKVKKSADPFSYTIDSCKTADGTWRVF